MIIIGNKYNPSSTQKKVYNLSLDGNVIDKVYDLKSSIKNKLINILLTNKTERIMNYEFGCSFYDLIFENLLDDELQYKINSIVTFNINRYLPEIELSSVNVEDIDDYSKKVIIHFRYKFNNTNDTLVVILS